MRRASGTEQTAAKAIAAVKGDFIDIGWGPMENDHHDIGTDLVVWVRDARLFDLGLVVGVQVKGDSKGDSSYFGEPARDDGEVIGWWYREDDRSHFDAWAASSVPHLLVLHNLKTDISYWLHVTADEVVETGKGAKVLVPRTNTIDGTHLGELMEIAAAGRPRVSWEGSAWSGAIPVPPDGRYRFALIVPRLVAPHPNAGVSGGLDEAGALALATQARLRDLERLCREVDGVPEMAEAEESEGWGWRFVGGLARYVLRNEADSLLTRSEDAPDAAARSAAAAAGACALLDLARPEEALELIEAALAPDDAEPVDYAWLCMQQARIWIEIGHVDKARASAFELLAIGRTAGDDVTATAIAGAAAGLIFRTSAPSENALQQAIAGGDTAAGWWRSQLLAWGLGELVERDFDSWTQDSSVTIGAEDAAGRHLKAASLTANHVGEQGAWRHARGLLARHELMPLNRHADPSEAAAGIELLRVAGDSKAIKTACRKLAADGPAEALRIAGGALRPECSTKTTALADLTLLERCGDLLDSDAADRMVDWLLTTLADPHPFVERITPTFLVEVQCVESLAGIVAAAGQHAQAAAVAVLLELPPQGNQIMASAWAKVLLALPSETWDEENTHDLGPRADAHNFVLRDAMLSIAARFDEGVREQLREEARTGSTRALGALGDVTELPTDVAAGLIAQLGEAVRDQISEARSGTHGMGEDIARNLALLNLWHPEVADWEPLFEQLAEPVVIAEHKRGAVALLAEVPEQIPASIREHLGSLATNLVRNPAPTSPFFGEGEALLGASVKLALALGALEETESRERLLDLMAGSEQERRWAAHAIAVRGVPAEAPLLIGLLQDGDPNVRAIAAGAMAQLQARACSDDLADRALERALKDPGTWVAASVVGTLEGEAKLSQESEAIVVELKSHPSAHVRASADRVLAGRETSD
jgi:hypothetical protein